VAENVILEIEANQMIFGSRDASLFRPQEGGGRVVHVCID